RRRHTRSKRDWSSDVCSSDLISFTLSLDSTQVYTTSGTATSASYAWNSASVAKSWRSSITRVVRGGPRHGPPHPPTLGAPRGTRPERRRGGERGGEALGRGWE